MPPRTRVKRDAHGQAADSKSAVIDVQGDSDNAFAQLAQKHWLKSSKKTAKVKVKPDVLKKEIWDVLQQDDFAFRSLLALENLQVLEKYYPSAKASAFLFANHQNSYLWPGYNEDSSNFHVILIALILNVKTREHLPTWS